MSEQEREQEIVSGKLDSILEKGGGKYQALVIPEGSQYAKRLWTKSEEAVFWLRGRLGEPVNILCNISPGEVDGKPVKFRWIDRVDVEGADVRASSPGGEPASGGPARVSPSQPSTKDTQIHRQTATKVAVQMLAYLDPQFRTMGKLVDLSNLLVKYYETGESVAYSPNAIVGGDTEDIPFL